MFPFHFVDILLYADQSSMQRLCDWNWLERQHVHSFFRGAFEGHPGYMLLLGDLLRGFCCLWRECYRRTSEMDVKISTNCKGFMYYIPAHGWHCCPWGKVLLCQKSLQIISIIAATCIFILQQNHHVQIPCYNICAYAYSQAYFT